MTLYSRPLVNIRLTHITRNELISEMLVTQILCDLFQKNLPPRFTFHTSNKRWADFRSAGDFSDYETSVSIFFLRFPQFPPSPLANRWAFWRGSSCSRRRPTEREAETREAPRRSGRCWADSRERRTVFCKKKRFQGGFNRTLLGERKKERMSKREREIARGRERERERERERKRERRERR